MGTDGRVGGVRGSVSLGTGKVSGKGMGKAIVGPYPVRRSDEAATEELCASHCEFMIRKQQGSKLFVPGRS
jgi:hypothetical protein